MSHSRSRLVGVGFAVIVVLWSVHARAADLNEHQQLLFAIYKQLVETNTTDSSGDNTLAAQRLAAWLREEGFAEEQLFVGGSADRKGNLIARMPGSGQKRPLLLMAHLDVVEADPADWSVPPFELTEKEGYYYGRGTTDQKAMSAIWIANLIRFRREGFVPNRDLIVALTADEEGGGYNGIRWLLENHRDLIDAEFAINEGGSGALMDGVRIANSIQVAEKIYADFTLTVRNPGGHSSIPQQDNAIYRLADALIKIRNFTFPMELNPTLRLSLERRAVISEPEQADDIRAILKTPPDEDALQRLSDDPVLNAQLRTTAVATMLEGGHANNALPQLARAVVNVRMMPGSDPDAVRNRLIQVVSDPEVEVSLIAAGTPSDPSPLTGEILPAVDATTQAMWPGVPVIPTMATGATDGAKTRNAGIPTYGVSGIFSDMRDIRAHGRDERILVQSLYEGQEFLYRLVKTLASSSGE